MPFRPALHELWSWWDERRRAAAPPDGVAILYPQVAPDDPDEVAYRAVLQPWCDAVTPRVILRTVPL